MFHFIGTRKPDFKNISRDIYHDYWKDKGDKMRSILMEREDIFFEWIPERSKVLSIGCGNSRLLYELKQKKKCEACGIDIEDSVVGMLNRQGIRSFKADISRDDFDLGKIFSFKFDYIILSELLEHLAMPENLMLKIRKCSNYFAVSIPNSAFYRYRTGLMFGGRFFTQWIKHPAEHLRYWSHVDFLDWLDALGFTIAKTQSSNGPSGLKDLWPNMFGHQICYLAKPDN
jgi:methionine biosynthesis protein MetW